MSRPDGRSLAGQIKDQADILARANSTPPRSQGVEATRTGGVSCDAVKPCHRTAIKFSMQATHPTGTGSVPVESRGTRWFDCPVRRQLDGMPGAVVLLHNGMIVEVNSRVAAILGCPAEQVIGHRLDEFTSVNDSSKLARWLQWEIQAPLLVVAVRKDGGVFSLQLERHGHMTFEGRRVCMTSLMAGDTRPELHHARTAFRWSA